MSGASPGHQKWPEHQVLELPEQREMQVELDGLLLAKAADVIKVVEDGAVERFYFPRSAVNMQALRASQDTTVCPFKGRASYFDIVPAGAAEPVLKDAVWSYENPYDEHAALKGRLAFADDKFAQIRVHAPA